MDNDIQVLVVEAREVAEALGGKYAPPTDVRPVNLLDLGISDPVIWLEEPNAEVTGVPALSARPVDCRVGRKNGDTE